jgi:hypothetical protein
MSTTATEINKTTKLLNTTISKKEFFDPRIIEDDSNKALWTSNSVNLAVKGLGEGYKLKENPFLKTVRGALLRKANLPFKYSKEELEVMQIILEDKEFFCDNFGRLKDGDLGYAPITLRDYQRNLLKRYTQNRWNIVMFPRQSGKTTTTVLEILHFCITNIDKDIVVIAQSDKVINEILTKIKESFAGLPFFMQPGFVSFNKKGFVLDNGCRLTIGIASESVVQGYSLDFLYIDEFAYIKASMVKAFWNNIYPTLINNPNSKCIITSTPNGRNMFYNLWTGAEAKINKFIPYRIYWYDVPGRDEQFKYDTIANIGQEGWEMGFECSFDTQLKSIFNSKVQQKLRNYQLNSEKLWSKDNHQIGNKYNISFISQQFVQYDLKNDYFLFGIDLGEGLEQDSTTLKIKKIEWSVEKQKLIYKSVGVFKDNSISVEDFAELSMEIMNEFNKDNIRTVVENNTYGGEYFLQIKNLQLHDERFSNFDNIVFAKFHRQSKDDFEYGIRWNGNNKKLGVKSFSNLISTDVLIEYHYLSIEEYLNFGRLKNDTYAAQYGHDDLVMADVSISHYIKSTNIYSVAFLNVVIEELRRRCNDEDLEIIKKREEIARKEAAVYTHNGFQMRDHEKIKQEKNDDIYLFGMLN